MQLGISVNIHIALFFRDNCVIQKADGQDFHNQIGTLLRQKSQILYSIVCIGIKLLNLSCTLNPKSFTNANKERHIVGTASLIRLGWLL